jgi:tripartite-type tricarboxylate transporter receptor subunit TctC
MFTHLRSQVVRVFLVAAVLALLGVGSAGTVAAQSFPTGPITLICPWPAGGGSDIAMRLVADAASKKLGVPVVVVNKPGAGSTIGMHEVATSKPDGYTLGMAASATIAAQYTNPNADEISAFTPIAFFGEDPSLISARAETGYKNVADFVNYAKANPGKIKNGNDQPPGSSYVAIAVFEKKLNVKVTRVPYAGFAPTVIALLSGELDTATVPAPDVAEHHRAGKVRVLGVAATARHFLLPDVPTFREQGFDVVVGSWRAIAGPAGIPADRLRILESKFVEAMNEPEFKERAKNAGFIVTPKGSAETLARWKADDEEFYPILLEAGLVKFRQKR